MRRALAFAVVGAVVLAFVIVQARSTPESSPGPKTHATGVVAGPVQRVFLLNAAHDVKLEAALGDGGRYSLDVPLGDLAGARIIAESRAGAATQSPALATAGPVGASVTLPPLELWPARVEIQRRESQVRFSWPPLEANLADRLRYSLILTFTAAQESGPAPEDATIVVRVPEVIQTIEEIYELMPKRAPHANPVTVRVRAFDAAAPDGGLWASVPTTWTLDADFPEAR